MEHKDQLEELNKASLQRFDDYLKTKKDIDPDDHQKVQQAKDEWQVSWNKFMETLLVLERLEI